MTITVDLSSDLEAMALMQAQKEGLSVEDYLAKLLQRALQDKDATLGPEPNADTRLDEKMARGQQRAERFLQWAEGHGQDTPLLSEDAVSREAVYKRPG